MTHIPGAAWRVFYTDLWPTDWYIDDTALAFEDDNGRYILPDTHSAPLSDYGLMGYQGRMPNQPKELIDIQTLWQPLMEARSQDPMTPDFLRS